ncbi:MAG: Multidrug resistance protein MdtC [Deltaproteobacteria bacterium ADurb.Bin510]|nr:MAG: Multidrug resistance protein MdtC [Deltaproteobacteria bacterium ADurb.Bin510]
MMGMIILMGIVVSNGIVMIDFINRLRRAGQERTPAIIQGAVVRLRPILITSITAILGMLPMAVSKGQGSEMTSPMAVAVAFGLLFSTAMTLYVVPAAYALADELSIKVKRQSRRIVLGE